MSVACKIKLGSNGEMSVVNTDGSPSKLYDKALTYLKESTVILSPNIDVNDSRNRKGIVSTEELKPFIGEDRLGSAEMQSSRERINELKDSILKEGFKQPIVVMYDQFSNNGEASIIEGNHRMAAAIELGLEEVPVVFEKGTLRSNSARLSDGMFPLNRKLVGKIDTRFGVDGTLLGLSVRQPSEDDYLTTSSEEQQEGALNIWKAAQTEDFVRTTGITKEDEASVEEVLKFLDTDASNNKRLNSDQRSELAQVMKDLGLYSLEDLNTTLMKIFKPKGIFSFNEKEALASGLYTFEDLQDLDLEEVSDLLERIEGELRVTDMVIQEVSNEKTEFTDSSKRNILGGSLKITQTKIEDEIISKVNDFSNVSEIEAVIQDLPYQDFVDKFNDNKSFKDSLLENLSDLTRVQVLNFNENGEASIGKSVESTIKNTLLYGVDTSVIEADIEYFEGISEEILDQNKEQVKQVLKQIEKDLIENNLDIIGLSEANLTKAELLDTLRVVKTVFEQGTDESITKLADIIREKIGTKLEGEVLELPLEYKGLTVVKVDSLVSDDVLYKDHGLIPIGDNLYHKVQRDNISAGYEYLYSKLVADEITIPQEFITVEDYKDPQNKVQVLKDLSSFIASRETGVETELQEEVSLNQVVFSHLPIVKPSLKTLGDIKTKENYLKGKFVSDFYNYYLQEKLKDSQVYRNTLSKFSFNEKDISLNSKLEVVEGIKYEQELKDYMRLKNDPVMNKIVESELVEAYTTEEHLMLNNRSLIKPYQDRFVMNGDYVTIESGKPNFIKIGKEDYRKALERGNTAVYYKLSPKLDSVYNTLDTTNNFNMSEVKEVLEETFEQFPKTVSQEFEVIKTYDETQEDPLKEIDSCK